MLQPPQLNLSGLVQTPLQQYWPALQPAGQVDAAQIPATQDWLDVQTFPHTPQLFGSDDRSAQPGWAPVTQQVCVGVQVPVPLQRH